MTSESSFQINFILRRPPMANFAEIIKTVTMFIKSTLKNWNKVEWIRNYAIYISFFDITKVDNFR